MNVTARARPHAPFGATRPSRPHVAVRPSERSLAGPTGGSLTWRLVVGLAVLVPVACKPAAEVQEAAPVPKVHVASAKVEARPMPHDLLLTGSLLANQQADVAANVVGRITKTYVERGSNVGVEAPLAQVDTRSAALSEAEAKANLEVAQAQQTLAKAQCERNQELLQKGAISKDEWDRINSQCQTSVGSAAAATARADLARKTISDGTIRAPFAGMVSDRLVSVGEYVLASTKVATVVELQVLRLQMTVPEANIGDIREGQNVRFGVQAYPDTLFTGTVQYIGPAVRSASRDLLVEARVDNRDKRLRPGMFTTAHLELPDVALPAVPKSALRQDETTTHMFVLVDGHIEERIVQMGPERDGVVGIVDGLRAGETYVTELSRDIKDGLAVN